MEFHEPDSRWAGFGCSSYEHYLDRYLIRGKFHNKVPNAVTDAYITIEYLMAHAYYFYPMYDEALSKLLRTMEMAVKLRCKEIGIDIVVKRSVLILLIEKKRAIRELLIMILKLLLINLLKQNRQKNWNQLCIGVVG